MISRSTRNATSSSAGKPQKSLNSYAFAALVVTFSSRNTVASGKYSRGNCESRHGFHAECLSDDELIFMRPGLPSAVHGAAELGFSETDAHISRRRGPTSFP